MSRWTRKKKYDSWLKVSFNKTNKVSSLYRNNKNNINNHANSAGNRITTHWVEIVENQRAVNLATCLLSLADSLGSFLTPLNCLLAQRCSVACDFICSFRACSCCLLNSVSSFLDFIQFLPTAHPHHNHHPRNSHSFLRRGDVDPPSGGGMSDGLFVDVGGLFAGKDESGAENREKTQKNKQQRRQRGRRGRRGRKYDGAADDDDDGGGDGDKCNDNDDDDDDGDDENNSLEYLSLNSKFEPKRRIASSKNSTFSKSDSCFSHSPSSSSSSSSSPSILIYEDLTFLSTPSALIATPLHRRTRSVNRADTLWVGMI